MIRAEVTFVVLPPSPMRMSNSSSPEYDWVEVESLSGVTYNERSLYDYCVNIMMYTMSSILTQHAKAVILRVT